MQIFHSLFISDLNFGITGQAWGLWRESKAMDLIDETLCETCDANEFLKCLNVTQRSSKQEISFDSSDNVGGLSSTSTS